MAKCKGISPTSSEVESHILKLRARFPRLVEVAVAGRSTQGRPIHAVTVADSQRPANDKQHVLIVAGQHGNEESGRMVALAVLDWLVSPGGRQTRARQKIVVMPCVNPDGADADTHLTPGGVAPNLDHAPGGAKTSEGIAVEKVADALQPELFVDMHSRGYAGCSYDMVLYPGTKEYTEDDNILHAIAAEMAQAGEQAGIPQMTHPLTWSGWGGPDPNQPSTTMYAYRRFKSIVILTENSESNDYSYPAAVRIRSGLAKMKVLLSYGNRRHPKLYYRGYPCYLASGMFLSGIVAVGKTAAQRRASRLAAWENRGAFKKLSAGLPEKPREKRFLFQYKGKVLPAGAGIQTFARGRLRVKSVTLNGRRLGKSETNGYYAWHDVCATFVVVVLPRIKAGTYRIDVRYS